MPSSMSNLPELELSASATPVVAPPDGLIAILNAIAGDSQQQPSLYLDETVVPYGGE